MVIPCDLDIHWKYTLISQSNERAFCHGNHPQLIACKYSNDLVVSIYDAYRKRKVFKS